jgi:uncharacterized membrane protein YqjE
MLENYPRWVIISIILVCLSSFLSIVVATILAGGTYSALFSVSIMILTLITLPGMIAIGFNQQNRRRCFVISICYLVFLAIISVYQWILGSGSNQWELRITQSLYLVGLMIFFIFAIWFKKDTYKQKNWILLTILCSLAYIPIWVVLYFIIVLVLYYFRLDGGSGMH